MNRQFSFVRVAATVGLAVLGSSAALAQSDAKAEAGSLAALAPVDDDDPDIGTAGDQVRYGLGRPLVRDMHEVHFRGAFQQLAGQVRHRAVARGGKVKPLRFGF